MAFTTVTGTIGRTFYSGKGAEVVESWQANGETMTKRWSAFFEQEHGLQEGAEVTVSGIHGDKVDEWDKDGTTRHSVKRTLNKAKVKQADRSANASIPQPAEQPDTWNAAPLSDTDIPF